jgi:uncharacterized protein (TIGR02996 family)
LTGGGRPPLLEDRHIKGQERNAMNDETPFIEAILANPEDEAPRLIYADWLEERGDARGEFLRLENALANLPRGDARGPSLRARIQEVRQGIGVEWLAQVDRSRIEGCVQFAFTCPKQWDQLARTADPLARFCETCQQNVYHCSSVAQARRHAARAHCVAVDSRLTRKKDDLTPSDFYGHTRQARGQDGMVMMTMGIITPPPPCFRPGNRVLVRRGKYRGNQGTVKDVRMSLLRAMVQLDRKPTAVELDFDDLQYIFRGGRR